METQAAYDAKEIPSIADTLMNIIPTNPFNSLSEQNLLQIIFFALLLGFSLIKLGDKGAPVLDFFRAWTEAWKEITNIVILQHHERSNSVRIRNLLQCSNHSSELKMYQGTWCR